MTAREYYDKYGIYINLSTAKNFSSPLHSHLSYEIYYLLHGERDYFIEDTFFKVNEGEFALIPQYKLHKTSGLGGTRILISVTEESLKSYFNEKTVKDLLSTFNLQHVKPQKKDSQRVVDILTTIVKLRELGNNDVIYIYIAELLYIIKESIPVENVLPSSNALIKKVTEYINKNYNNIKGIEDTASHFFVNKSYLCRTFKKTIGIPFVTYLNKLRVKKATELLISTNKEITEIAELCGFNSTAYFCNIFKSELGISPLAYRHGGTARNVAPISYYETN